jgi:hypothetical protein
LREADAGRQSADTIKLNFRFRRAQWRGPLHLDELQSGGIYCLE